MDRSRYDSAMFWLPFGTTAAVIGLALMTIGVTRLWASQSVGSGFGFGAGLGPLPSGALLLLGALVLSLPRRGEAPGASRAAGPPGAKGEDWKADAVRGYYRDREN